MTNTICPRCRNKFYIAVQGPHLTCPFCGFSFKITEPRRRKETRAATQRDCELLKGSERIFVQTLDISKSGVGVKMTGSMPIDKDDTLQVIIKDFEMDSPAQVVWVKRFASAMSWAGLKFR
jgi:hypothetical protein